MLSDVGSLWYTASTAIVQALEKLDTDIANASNDNSESLAQVNDDLEAYKKLLDDAQMQHLELSKQSRLLIAEKDAEIQHLKKQLVIQTNTTTSDNSSNDNMNEVDVNLALQKALSEKQVLEASLREVEEQLRDSVHAKNELQVLNKSYDELKKRYEIMKDDFTKLRQESEVLEKQRTDTIENLASEYSRLAADSELIRQRSEARVIEVIKENEILVTKMHALEHSITELADRASSSTLTASPKRGNSSFNVPSSPSSSSSSASVAATTPVVSAESPATIAEPTLVVQDNPALVAELKETKAKLVNVQFDLKQRDDDIHKLKTSILESEQGSQEKVTSLSKKVQLLEEEKLEFHRRIQSKQQEIEKLQEEIKSLRQQQSSTADISSGQQELLTQQYEKEIAKHKQTIASLESTIQEDHRSFTLKVDQLQNEVTTMQSQLQASNQEIETLKAEILAKESAFLQLKQAADVEKTTLEAQLATLQMASNADKDAATQEFLAKINQLEEALSVAKQAKEALLEEHARDKTKLEASFAAELATTKSTMQQAEQENLTAQRTQLESTFSAEKSVLEARIIALEQSIVDAQAEFTAMKEQLQLEQEALVKEERKKVTDELQLEHQQALQQAEEKASQTLATTLAAQIASHEQAMQSALTKMQLEMIAEKEHALTALTQSHEESLQATIQRLEKEAKLAQEKALQALQQEKDAEKQQALQDLIAIKSQELQVAISDLEQKHQQHMQLLQQEKEQEILAIQLAMQKIQSELQVVESKHEAKLQAALLEVEQQKEQEKLQAVATTRSEMQTLVDRANTERDEHLANYTKERVLRKRIHNKLLEIQGNIRVICRIRPINDVERRSGEDIDVTDIVNEEEFFIQRDAQTKTKFEYDRVFGQISTQTEVFESVQPLCVSVLDGYNVCIFAYGQTGSGKTFTMEGYDDLGVTPRAMMELFRQIENVAGEWTYTLSLSILEIYNESIHDLLNNSNSGASKGEKEKLDIRQTPEGNVVAGLTEVPISTMDQVNELMRQGKNNRAVGKHDMNEHSSRSHSIVTVVVRGQNRLDNATTFGKLHLIDLAGSERISKTDASGDRLKEAQNINKSLLALGDVINALGNKKSLHVPYRNSKLTFLLQDSLGGNSKVLMFVNISPAVYNLGETVCSLNFASKCRSTELGQAKKQTGPAGGDGSGGSETSAAKQLLAEKRRALMSPSASQSNLLASSSAKK